MPWPWSPNWKRKTPSLKSGGLPRPGIRVTDKYRLMFREEGLFTITLMARLLGVSRTGYYTFKARLADFGDDFVPGSRAARRAWLTDRIWVHWDASKGRRGARRIQVDLAERDGEQVSLSLIRKIMKAMHIAGIQPRATKRTTISADDLPARPDRVRRRQRDLLLRPVELTQYTLEEYANTAHLLDVCLSVGRTGVCWDNAVAEYIEVDYNRRRRHSAIDYRIPAMPALIMQAVPATESGAANGLNALMRSLGTTIASAVTGAILAHSITTVGGVTGPSEHGFLLALALGLGAAILSVIIAAFIPRPGAR